MGRIGAVVVLVVLLITALLYWNPETAAPTGDASPPAVEQPATPQPAVTDAKTASPAEASSPDRVAVQPANPSPEYIVRGVVLADERSPDLSAGRVLAYLGAAQDTGGLLSGAMTGQRGSSRRSAFMLDGDPIAETAIGSDGHFELRTSERHLRIALDHDLYLLGAPEIVHISAETRSADIVLSPLLGGMVRGRLLGERAADVAFVTLALEVNPMSAVRDPQAMMAAMMSATRPPAVASKDQTFVFRAVAPSAEMRFGVRGGRASAVVREPGMQPGEVRDVIVPVNTTAMLSVEVADEDGRVIPAASVSARPTDVTGIAASMQALRGNTGEDGICLFESIPAGDYRIEAMASGRTSSSLMVTVAVKPEATQAKLVLAEGGVVTGIVQTQDGQPIAYARVAHHPLQNIPMLGDLADQLGPEYLGQVARGGAETDEQGRFRLSGLADTGAFLVIGAHGDYVAGIARDVHMGDEDVVITLQPLSSVTGMVVAEDGGEAIRNYTVAILRTSFLILKMPIAREIIDDESGAFRIEAISADSYTLKIESDGYGTRQLSIKVPKDGNLDVGTLSLQRAASIRGFVRDENGQPIANALVRKRQGAMADNPMLTMMMGSSARTYSDAEGRFLLTPLSPGRLQLLASEKGYASGRSERVRLAAGQEVTDVIIELGHGGSIHGKLEFDVGQSTQDFMLIVQHQVTQNTASVDFQPNGSFVAENLDPGPYQVQAMPADLIGAFGGMDVRPGEGFDVGKMMRKMTDNVVSQRCKVRSGEVTEVSLDVRDLAIGAQWTVHVQVGGKPQRNGLVEATSLDTGTLRIAMLDEGVATFARMQAGRHRLQVRFGLAMTPVGEPQDLTYPDNVQEHVTTISLPGGELRGRVIDDESEDPLGSAIVRLHHDGYGERDDPIGMCLSNTDGEFAFTGLADGTYSLVAAQPMASTGHNLATRRAGIRIEAGTTTDRIELRSRPAAGASVLVTTIDGRPIAGATVLCVDEQGRPLGSLGMAATGPDGKAWFGGMANGQARVVGRARGFAPSASTMQTLASERTTRFTLTLGDGAPTRLSVVNATGQRLRGVKLNAKFEDGPWLPAILLVQTMARDGTFDLGRLGPGRWTFRATHPSIGSLTHERTIRGTAPTTIVISEQ